MSKKMMKILDYPELGKLCDLLGVDKGRRIIIDISVDGKVTVLTSEYLTDDKYDDLINLLFKEVDEHSDNVPESGEIKNETGQAGYCGD